MKLYAIRTADGHVNKDAGFFEGKSEAKKVRDELNGGTPAELTKQEKHAKYFITRGPDNFRYTA